MGVNHRDSFIDISWRHAALTNNLKETEMQHQQTLYKRWLKYTAAALFFLLKGIGWLVLLVLRFGVLRDNLNYEFSQPILVLTGASRGWTRNGQTLFRRRLAGHHLFSSRFS